MIKKERVPYSIVLIGVLLSTYLMIRGLVNYLVLFLDKDPELLSSILLSNSHEFGFFGFVFCCSLCLVTWLASTKVKEYQKTAIRVIIFINLLLAITFNYLWFITVPILKHLIPYFQAKFDVSTSFKETIFKVFLHDNGQLFLIIKCLPLLMVVFAALWMFNLFAKDEKEIIEAFLDFEYPSALLQKFAMYGQIQTLPDVIVGPNSKTKENVIIPGKDRTLNKIIVGSIGTGKTATILLNMINQDLHWMTKFINKFPVISKLENFDDEVKQDYLNGITIIEPSNDLCQKSFKLVKAHKIPEESVFYIDPTNPNTPSINPLQGPVEKVAEAFTMVVEGLSEGNGNFFFEQSQRNHFKQYIYLLKLYDVNNLPTFDQLIDMYNDPQLVHVLHEKLKNTIPANIEHIQDRDERNYWLIVKGVDEWFDMNHVIERDRNGSPLILSGGNYHGQPKYYDAQAEYVKGLRNILNDLAASPLIRRVLFGHSDFDFDRHLEIGGVLLVNTAKGELGSLSNVLGKLILLSIQNAVFRRTPNLSAYHSIYCDEFPDYIYEPFMSFPAQSRKYKAIVVVAAQTIAQLAHKYGDTYAETLLTTLRNKIVFSDVSEYDANKFSKIFGESNKFTESTSESSVSPLQDTPMTRTGSTYSKESTAVLSANDIIMQREFQAAVKIVKNNRTRKAVQVSAKFVNDNEWEEAVVLVDEQAGQEWLEARKKMKVKSIFSNDKNEVEEDYPIVEVMPVANEVEDIEDIQDSVVAAPVEVPIKATTITPKKQPSKEYEVVTSKPRLRVGMLRANLQLENEDKNEIEESIKQPMIKDVQAVSHSEPKSQSITVTEKNVVDATQSEVNHKVPVLTIVKEKEEQQAELDIIDFSQLAVKGLSDNKDEVKNYTKPNPEQQKVYDEIFSFVEDEN